MNTKRANLVLVEYHAARVTAPQLYALRRLNDDESPLHSRRNTGGAVRRMLERLRYDELVSGPPWKITRLGERVLARVDGEGR